MDIKHEGWEQTVSEQPCSSSHVPEARSLDMDQVPQEGLQMSLLHDSWLLSKIMSNCTIFPHTQNESCSPKSNNIRNTS